MWQTLKDADYFALKNTFGSSDLKKILQSPAHVRIETNATAAMARGTLVHKHILENQEMVLMPEFNNRTTQGKADKLAWLQVNESSLVADISDFEMVTKMKQSVLKNEYAKSLLDHKNTVFEQAGIYNFEDVLNLRIKPDIRNKNLKTIADLKTISDCSGDLFARSATAFKYFLQAALYLDIANLIDGEGTYDTFLFIAVETNRPHGTRIFELDRTAIELGRDQYRKALGVLKNCIAADTWPAYGSEIEILTPPAYAMYWEN